MDWADARNKLEMNYNTLKINGTLLRFMGNYSKENFF